jgi:hypothetical protein
MAQNSLGYTRGWLAPAPSDAVHPRQASSLLGKQLVLQGSEGDHHWAGQVLGSGRLSAWDRHQVALALVISALQDIHVTHILGLDTAGRSSRLGFLSMQCRPGLCSEGGRHFPPS